jgi:hypothetical protein
MGLVVAVVVARTDVDEADRRFFRIGPLQGQRRREAQRGRALQKMATGNGIEFHGVILVGVAARYPPGRTVIKD